MFVKGKGVLQGLYKNREEAENDFMYNHVDIIDKYDIVVIYSNSDMLYPKSMYDFLRHHNAPKYVKRAKGDTKRLHKLSRRRLKGKLKKEVENNE